MFSEKNFKIKIKNKNYNTRPHKPSTPSTFPYPQMEFFPLPDKLTPGTRYKT
jgi:hypothetical protein